MTKRERSDYVYRVLMTRYPNQSTFLTHKNPFELLIAVILSAQCTDQRVNMVTPALFAVYPDCTALATAPLDEIKHVIRSINFFNNKATHIKQTAQIVLERYQGDVPQTLSDLVQLPGVGRKTANVVLGQAFGIPGITVDTHVNRVSNRLGFTRHKDPVRVEKALMRLWPRQTWINYSTILILHGRHTCGARAPDCGSCDFNAFCPSAVLSPKSAAKNHPKIKKILN